MAGGAQLSVTDLRRASRHPVDFSVIAEHLLHGDLKMHISNVSAHGFMTDGAVEVARGDRLIVRLPAVGRIEAYCIWVTHERAGFQFERIVRLDDFQRMISEMQPNPALRRRG
ncbi:PilZ domain-containing protein [Erythrobacter sp. EC-HK427]|uniref:PilZ domain-containing protein n=1 Tax=Erythrobacter sp. EC-HK427 TaxID=2038396 RepID=UPI00125BB2FA|nr:PilZ domain-containing protein [Erythrobacter sp. EC-HK427]VVT15924.1 Pilus assembly protein PilZ [Erythrobacter sp. EC-HK427]